jgi:hypothetical protein
MGPAARTKRAANQFSGMTIGALAPS